MTTAMEGAVAKSRQTENTAEENNNRSKNSRFMSVSPVMVVFIAIPEKKRVN
jgi:hypothetical protein